MTENFKCVSCKSVLVLGPKVKQPKKDFCDKEIGIETQTIFICPVCSGEMKRGK